MCTFGSAEDVGTSFNCLQELPGNVWTHQWTKMYECVGTDKLSGIEDSALSLITHKLLNFLLMNLTNNNCIGQVAAADWDTHYIRHDNRASVIKQDTIKS